MSWYDESETEQDHTREWLAEYFPGETTVVLVTFDVAWSGWECDWKGALITHGGMPELVMIDGTSMVGNIPDALEQRVREYRRLADETEAALQRYRALGGLFGDAWQEATNAGHRRQVAERRQGESEQDHQARIPAWAPPKVESHDVTSELITTLDLSRRPALAAELERSTWELRRDPEETDAEYADRKTLFDNGGRMVLDVASLPIAEVREILTGMHAMIDIAKAAELMNSSPDMVLHHVRVGDLHLSREQVVALYLEELQQRQELREMDGPHEDADG